MCPDDPHVSPIVPSSHIEQPASVSDRVSRRKEQQQKQQQQRQKKKSYNELDEQLEEERSELQKKSNETEIHIDFHA